MIFGIIVGTYSSLYVAAPAILLWGVRRGREGEARPPRKRQVKSEPLRCGLEERSWLRF